MKVLIVDDETVVRVGLKSMINWENNGYYLIGEACNGEKALEIMKKIQPDIVITDVKMPVMDGIDLIKEAKRLQYATKFIVLSSYSDFELVKEALKLGAEDYLLKLEMEPEHLLEILKCVTAKIRETKKQETKKQKLDRHLLSNVHQLRRKFFEDLIYDMVIDEKDFYDSLELLNINLNMNNVCSMVLKIAETNSLEMLTEQDIHVMNFSVINIVEEIVKDDFSGYCFKMNIDEYCLIFSKKIEDINQMNQKEVINTARRLTEMLNLYLNIKVVIGIGEIQEGLYGIRKTYQQAAEALEYRFFNIDTQVIAWNKIDLIPTQDREYSILHFKEKLHQALDFQQEEVLNNVFNHILEELSGISLSYDNACSIKLELFYMIAEFFEKSEINIKDILKNSYCSYQQLVRTKNISEVIKWFKQVEADLLEYIGKISVMDYPRVVAKAKEYIEEYYTKDISLGEVADVVNLNSSYFSTLFSQYTGMNYTEYITDIRLNKAKELLQKTDYRVYEIAQMIGYQNTYYFNRIFKKVMGMTPKKYRNKASSYKQ